MTSVEILAEEPSCKAVLDVILPEIIPDTPFAVRVFNGRPDLLRKLPQRLAGYRNWMRDTELRVVVLIDRDKDDCTKLKQNVEGILADSGLISLTTALPARPADACTRIIVEHLESWFFGDIPALTAAYPRLPTSLASQARYRDPDAIAGGAWRALERLLVSKGYGERLIKGATASAVAANMNVESNRSKSFQVFRDGVRRLVLDSGAP